MAALLAGDVDIINELPPFSVEQVRNNPGTDVMTVNGTRSFFIAMNMEGEYFDDPKVREAAVYSVPDERLGEEVGATIYAEPGIDVDELRTFLEAHLAKFEVPRYVLSVTEPLPRTASGKILKRELRAPFWEGKDRGVN